MRPRQFCRTEILRKLDPKNLLDFLTPYSEYLHQRGFDFSSDNTPSDLAYEKLSAILLAPTEATPPELVEALHYVNDLCSPEGFDALQEAINGSILESRIPSEVTAADLAVMLWCIDRQIIERVHAETVIMKTSSFEYFKSAIAPVPIANVPSSQMLASLETELNEFFKSIRRGATAKISVIDKGDSVWFLVRHGEPLKRETAIKDGQSVPLFYRPEKTDIVVFNKVIAELRIRIASRSKKLLEYYREKFGEVLFGRNDFFNNRSKFTLEPLRIDREESLICSDIPELKDVRLTCIQLFRGGSQRETEIRRAEDLFRAAQENGIDFLKSGQIRKASFRLTFAHCKSPRTISVSNGNRAQFKRDEDAEVIEKWLARRGFITADNSETLCA
jgi:hypothetical protein